MAIAGLTWRSDLAQLASMCVGGDNCGSLSDSEARAHTRFKLNCSSELIALQTAVALTSIKHSITRLKSAPPKGKKLGDDLEVEGKDGYVAWIWSVTSP